MTELLQNLIEINIILVILFFGYSLIKSKLSFPARRYSLILLPIVSILSFLVKSNLNKSSLTSIPTIQLDVFTLGQNNLQTNSSNFNVNYVIYIVASLFLLYSLYKVVKIITFFNTHQTEQQQNYKLLITTRKDSFSFFNFIHLSAHLNEEEKNIVLEHELLHCEKKHSFDIILMEIYHAFFWYNPLLFLLKKELIHVHEYEVDQRLYFKYDKQYINQLLAYSLGVNSSQILLTSQFYNKLSLAKRTKIMTQKIKKNKAILFVLPIIAVSLTLVSLTKTNRLNNTKPNLNSEFITQDTIFDRVDVDPEYIGGDEAMFKFISENIVYPKDSKSKKIGGTVFTQFTITKDGKVKDVVVLKGVNEELDQESARVIALMPDWTPGELNQKRVNCKYILPIKFNTTD